MDSNKKLIFVSPNEYYSYRFDIISNGLGVKRIWIIKKKLFYYFSFHSFLFLPHAHEPSLNYRYQTQFWTKFETWNRFGSFQIWVRVKKKNSQLEMPTSILGHIYRYDSIALEMYFSPYVYPSSEWSKRVFLRVVVGTFPFLHLLRVTSLISFQNRTKERLLKQVYWRHNTIFTFNTVFSLYVH